MLSFVNVAILLLSGGALPLRVQAEAIELLASVVACSGDDSLLLCVSVWLPRLLVRFLLLSESVRVSALPSSAISLVDVTVLRL